jgi:hypothetical protein
MSVLPFLTNLFRRSTHTRRPQSARARLYLEPLEARINPDISLSSGHLVVTDLPDPHLDDVEIDVVSGGVHVELTPDNPSFTQRQTFAPGAVSSIDIFPNGEGGVSVYVNRTLPGVPLTIHGGGFVQLGGSGDPLYIAPTRNLDFLQGPITVDGPAGGTFIEVLDTESGQNANYTITENTVRRAGFGGLTYSNLRLMQFNGRIAANTINVNSTAFGSSYVLFTSNAIVNLGTGNLDTLKGSLGVVGSGFVFLNDQANPRRDTYRLDLLDAYPFNLDPDPEIRVTRVGFSANFLPYSPIRVFLNGGSASDTYFWEGLDSLPSSDNHVFINAGPGDDTFNVSSSAQDLDTLSSPLTVNGGGGSNVLSVNDQRADEGTIYSITSATIERSGDTSSVSSVSIGYSGVQSVTVNSGNHRNQVFVKSLAQGTNLIIRAGTGNDTVVAGNATNGVGDIRGFLDVFGAPLSSTTVILDDTANTSPRNFTVERTRVTFGNPGHVGYSGIQHLDLNGGSGGNDFALFETPLGLLTTINAGTGSDSVRAIGIGQISTLQGSILVNGQGNTTFAVFDQDTPTPQTYTLSGTATGASIARSGGFFATANGVRSLIVNGGSGGNFFQGNQFVVAAVPSITPVTLNASGDFNTLTGPSIGAGIVSWTITGPGSGRIGNRLNFTGMRDLVGGDSRDAFQFNATGSIAGTVNGGASDNELTYVAGPVTVNLQTRAAPQIRGGAAGGFSNLPVLSGSGSPGDILIGPDADTIWTVSDNNSGFGSTSTSRFTYTRFANLVGGAALDSFRFVGPGNVNGSIDGGAAPPNQGNWLTYAELNTPVIVKLQTGAATGVAGGSAGKVARIQHVHGSNGGSTLTGNAQGNVLIGGTATDTITGGSGPSLLIGDAGVDRITGGSGGDILVGDTTNFDTVITANQRVLMAILAEWQSADSYDTRFLDINTGNGAGLNGAFKLNFGTTVKDDGAADTVTAAAAPAPLDWFFQGTGDTLVNLQSGEHINNNTPAAFKDRTVTSSVLEGDLATVSGTITERDPLDRFFLEVNWGDGTPTETFTFPAGSDGQRGSVTHRYLRAGDYNIGLSWHDETGPANSATLDVSVVNVPPTVDAGGGNATIRCNQEFNRKGSFTDPGAGPWTALVDYGDGSGVQPLDLRGQKFKLHHKYREPGTYHVLVSVTDENGAVGTAAFDLTVT